MGLKLHVGDNILKFHALHAHNRPRTRHQKIAVLSVRFVSDALNLDPKTYHSTPSRSVRTRVQVACTAARWIKKIFYRARARAVPQLHRVGSDQRSKKQACAARNRRKTTRHATVRTRVADLG
jgi:hypothetical protein